MTARQKTGRAAALLAGLFALALAPASAHAALPRTAQLSSDLLNTASSEAYLATAREIPAASGRFALFEGDELRVPPLRLIELSYPKTRIGRLDHFDESFIGPRGCVSLEAQWSCSGNSWAHAEGLGLGREYLPQIDAYDFRARVLFPEIGRFAQEDPAGFRDSHNLYQAFLGSWSVLTDPSGLGIEPCPVGTTYIASVPPAMSRCEMPNGRSGVALDPLEAAEVSARAAVPDRDPCATSDCVDRGLTGQERRINADRQDYMEASDRHAAEAQTMFGLFGAAAAVAGAGPSPARPNSINLARPKVGSGPTMSSNPYQTRFNPAVSGRPNPQWSVDTRNFAWGARTENGGIRNQELFWKEWMAKNSETLSSRNKMLIRDLNVVPEVDSQWLKYFPEHAAYLRNRLFHHHVNQGPYAVPVPEGTHRGSGGPFHAK